MKLISFLISTFCIINAIQSDTVPFMDCGSQYIIDRVDFEGCSALPCIIQIGTYQNIDMDIHARTPSEILDQEVEVVLRGVHTKMPVTPDNACAQVSCPLDANVNATISATVTITDELVPLDGYLSWVMRNQHGDVLVCMIVDVIVTY